MTAPDAARVAEIAVGLTEAQRRAFQWTDHGNPTLTGRPRTLRSLAALGLCHAPKDHEITRTTVLARPAGLAVRDLLREEGT